VYHQFIIKVKRAISVNIATEYGLKNRALDPSRGRDLLLRHHAGVRTGTHPASYPACTDDFSSEI